MAFRLCRAIAIGTYVLVLPSIFAARTNNQSLSLLDIDESASGKNRLNEVRVLIQSLDPSQSIAISADGLKTTEDKQIDQIHCNHNKKNWVCNKKILSHTLLLSPRAGFLKVGSKILRGQIKLVPTKKELLVVNYIPLDKYVAGVVQKEMGSHFPEEALKAQIIATRSYTVATARERRQKKFNFDLYPSQWDQVYNEALDESPIIMRLVHQSEGMVLNIGKNVLKSYYHSSSGGFLEKASNVWGGVKESLLDFAYVAKKDPYSTHNQWQVNISPVFGEKHPNIGTLNKIKILRRSSGNRVQKLMLGGVLGKRIFSGDEFRKFFGTSFIKSTLFDVKQSSTNWTISGSGWGHGVGMSQLGAKKMAQQGIKSSDILKFYYPRARLGTL